MYKVNKVTSNQAGMHEDLIALVNKHQQSEFKRPIAAHTQIAFFKAANIVRKLSR